MLDCFRKCLNTGLDIFVLADMNINTSPLSSHNADYNLTSLNDTYMEFKISCGLVQMNKDLTRYASNQRPTLSDHVLTNRPSIIKNIFTKTNIISDHCHIITEISVKPYVERGSGIGQIALSKI